MKKKKKSTELKLRVSEAEKNRWKKCAEADGRTLSDWVRRAANKEGGWVG